MIGFCLNLAYQRGVIGRLRFQHVGNGDKAYIKSLLHLFELALYRSDFSVRGIETITGAQNIQVGLSHPHDQILFLGC